MAKDPAKPVKTKLNLTNATDRAQHINTARTHGRSYSYDVKKVMAALNCTYQQAQVVIQLAQIEDATQPSGKAAGR